MGSKTNKRKKKNFVLPGSGKVKKIQARAPDESHNGGQTTILSPVGTPQCEREAALMDRSVETEACLCVAPEHGANLHVEAVQNMMFEDQEQSDEPLPSDDYDILIRAVLEGDREIVQYILDKIDLARTDCNGNNVAHILVSRIMLALELFKIKILGNMDPESLNQADDDGYKLTELFLALSDQVLDARQQVYGQILPFYKRYAAVAGDSIDR